MLRDVPNMASRLRHAPKVCGCSSVCFSCSSKFFPHRFTQHKIFCIGKSTTMHHASCHLVRIPKFMFVDSLSDYMSPPIVFIIECGVVICPISLKHVSFGVCPFVLDEPHTNQI
jgi:hypothetical protein